MSNEPKPASLSKPKNGGVTKPKLRASCDACSLSKVKCDRQQPTCQRCQNLRVNCTYSPSRRMGKPAGSGSHKRAQQQAAQQAAQQAGMSRLGVLTPERDAPIDICRHNTAQSSLPGERSFNLGTASTFPYSGFGLSVPELVSLSQLQWNEPPYMIPLHESTTYFDHDDLLSTDLLLENYQSPPSTTSDPYEDSNMHQFFTPAPTPPSWRPSPPPTSHQLSKPFTPTTSSESLCRGNNDCHNLAFQTLASLNLPTAPSQSAGSPVSPPTIDQVLNNNRSAISTVTNILSCTSGCSLDPNFGMLLSLICTTILSSYESISKGKPTTSNCSSPDSYSLPGSPQPDPFYVETGMSITVGGYKRKLDAEEEEMMKINLVLNDVRKLSKFVDKYAERFCRTDSSDCGEFGICIQLEGFLRQRVKSTASGLRKMLNQDTMMD